MSQVDEAFGDVYHAVNVSGAMPDGSLVISYSAMTGVLLAHVSETAFKEFKILYLFWRELTADGRYSLPDDVMELSVRRWVAGINRNAWVWAISLEYA